MKKQLYLFCLIIIVLFTGCPYVSDYKLSNSTVIDDNLIGTWGPYSLGGEIASDDEVFWYGKNESYSLTRLSDYKYIFILTYKQKNGIYRTVRSEITISKVNSVSFINLPMFDIDEETNSFSIDCYIFAKYKLVGSYLYLYPASENSFKDNNTESYEFENSSDLTNYFKLVMKNTSFYDDADIIVLKKE